MDHCTKYRITTKRRGPMGMYSRDALVGPCLGWVGSLWGRLGKGELVGLAKESCSPPSCKSKLYRRQWG